MSSTPGAVTLSHQEAANEPQWKAEDSQTYATAREVLSHHSSLHQQCITTASCMKKRGQSNLAKAAPTDPHIPHTPPT